MRKNKYNNQKTLIDSIYFDSKAEARRYQELRLLARAGEIDNLTLQPRFLLQDKFTHPFNGHVRKIEYIADFMYFDTKEKRMIVEDVKGVRAKEYLLKKKLFLAQFHEYELREI